jgi:hypothetical protein
MNAPLNWPVADKLSRKGAGVHKPHAFDVILKADIARGAFTFAKCHKQTSCGFRTQDDVFGTHRL